MSSWTQNKSQSYREVVDNFSGFENTAGYFVGNEVLNTRKTLVEVHASEC